MPLAMAICRYLIGTTTYRVVNVMVIKLYQMDTLEYSGSIIVNNNTWEYRDVTDDHMVSVTRGMPLKAVLACMASFNMVYDMIED